MSARKKAAAVEVTEPPIVRITLGLKRLLDDDGTVRSIAAASGDFKKLLAQLQLDGTTPENMAEAGPLCCAIRKITEALPLFEDRARVLDSQKTTPEK